MEWGHMDNLDRVESKPLPRREAESTRETRFRVVEPDHPRRRVGIACSGGGIRSAVFCLGALQTLRREQILGQADFLSGVSGGGYIVAAHAATVAQSDAEA